MWTIVPNQMVTGPRYLLCFRKRQPRRYLPEQSKNNTTTSRACNRRLTSKQDVTVFRSQADRQRRVVEPLISKAVWATANEAASNFYDEVLGRRVLLRPYCDYCRR